MNSLFRIQSQSKQLIVRMTRPAFAVMLVLPCLFFAMILSVSSSFGATNDDLYVLGPDSLPHEGVPKGKIIGPLTLNSPVFTNMHTYWIYVPAQYERTNPACLMIFQDGHAFLNPEGDYRIPNVFDNL